MSWSVGFKGKPSEVKEVLAPQFATATAGTSSYPAEQQTVIQAHQIVNNVLDVMIASGHEFVAVSGSGSCSAEHKPNEITVKNVSFNLNINPWS